MFRGMAWKGKTYRSLPLASQQAVDSVSDSLHLQLSPRTSLVTFIWSVFSSNLPTILQR